MPKEPSYEKNYTDSFMKAAQYIVRLTAQQHVLEEFGRILVNYFQAQWVAFARRGLDGEIFLQDRTMEGEDLSGAVLTEKTRGTINDVLESGFLATETVMGSSPYTIVFLPLSESNRTTTVLIIAHQASQPLSQELLNLYLALTGIAGTTLDKISMERELRTYQSHLEELVKERTTELRVTNMKLEEEILERMRAEEGLRQQTLELQRLTETLDQRVRRRTTDLEKANISLQHLSSRLLSAQEEERKKVACEIHDSLGACFSAVKFKVETALQVIENAPENSAEFLKTVIPVIQEGIEECRRIQQDLRPPILDDLGLLSTLSWFCRRFQTIYAHIRIEQEIGVEEGEIPEALKIVIYRIIQEALNNIAKYSRADLVRLSLRKRNDRLEFTIQDNGLGFDLKKAQVQESTRKGLGLSSMTERAELSGGSFSIESSERNGTVIRAEWPI